MPWRIAAAASSAETSSGTGHELVARRDDLLGVAAVDVRPGDALARAGDHAGALHADDRRRRRAVTAAVALVHVAVVDADRVDVDEHLAVARRRSWAGPAPRGPRGRRSARSRSPAWPRPNATEVRARRTLLGSGTPPNALVSPSTSSSSASPSTNPPAMYHGHGPIRLSSELCDGLARAGTCSCRR